MPFSAPISQNPLNCSILFRTCLQGFLRNHDGDRPSPGQGSYQRWRERGVHRSRTNRSSSELVRMFKRSRVQNVAQPPSYVERDKPKLPPLFQCNNTPNWPREVRLTSPMKLIAIIRDWFPGFFEWFPGRGLHKCHLHDFSR